MWLVVIELLISCCFIFTDLASFIAEWNNGPKMERSFNIWCTVHTQCFSPLPALDSWCGLSSGCFFHTVSCLLGYWFIGLVETPALPPCSYSYISPGMWTPYTLCLATPLAPFSPVGTRGWDGWWGRTQPPRWADLWCLLSMQAVQRPLGMSLKSAGDSRRLRPDGPGLPVHLDAKYQTATPEWSQSVM